MKRTLKHRLLSCALAFILVVPVSLAGCGALGEGEPGDSQPSSTPQPQAATAVAAALQEKYEDSQRVRYAEGENAIARDHQFVIPIEFEPLELGVEYFHEMACIYYDAELTQRAGATYDFVDDTNTAYTIKPRKTVEMAPLGGNNKPELYPYGYADDSLLLFQGEPYSNWGNMGTLYLATKVDYVTGELLDKPTVQIYTLKGELDAPDLSVEVTNDGVVQFSWNEVRGAKAYYIAKLEYYEEDTTPTVFLIGSTTDTQWSSVPDEFLGGVTYANSPFTTFRISEDNWLDPAYVERYEGEFSPEDGAVTRDFDARRKFSVIAVNEQGSSMFSRLADINDVASVAPYSNAYNMNRQSEDGFSTILHSIESMPCYQWITLCNGTMTQRLVIYDYQGITSKTFTDLYSDQGWWPIEGVDDWRIEIRKSMQVPYRIDGTAFYGILYIYDYDASTARAHLDFIRERQEALQIKTGNVKRDIELVDEDEEEPVGIEGPVEIVVDDSAVTANSALSEYLALNMLSGVTNVDLSLFPESLDMEYLGNAWSEAFYQNPLILGVSDARVSRDGKMLYLEYEDDPESRARKQAEIKDTIAQVIPTIITSSMSARDKEFAINQYLCDTVEYDMAALENGEKYEFKMVDPEFNDSFTAYGAIVNGVGVCASYAASFKLLADAAGLNSVVVTGYIDGSLGHAWNRVELSPGRWATIDVTSNDSELMPNAILNVPDHVVATTLVEDNRWVMASAKSQYTNNDDADEYYRVTGMYFEEDEVVSEIAAQLANGDMALVRTDYMLSEDQFAAYCDEVFQTVQKDIAGYYWAGIIIIVTDINLLLE